MSSKPNMLTMPTPMPPLLLPATCSNGYSPQHKSVAASFPTNQRVQQLGAMHACFKVQAVLHKQEQHESVDHAGGKLALQVLTPKQPMARAA